MNTQRVKQKSRKVSNDNDTVKLDKAEDYLNKITYVSVAQARWTASILFATVLGLVGYVILLSIKFKKMKSLVASLVL